MPESTQNTDAGLMILTVHEVAKYLRMSEAKVYRLARTGGLPVVRIGRSWRFHRDLLDKWLSERTERSLHTDSLHVSKD